MPRSGHTLLPLSQCVCLCLYDSFSPFVHCLLCPKFYFAHYSPLWVMCGASWYWQSQKQSHIFTLCFSISLSPSPQTLLTPFSPSGGNVALRAGITHEGWCRLDLATLAKEGQISYCIMHLTTGINCNASWSWSHTSQGYLQILLFLYLSNIWDIQYIHFHLAKEIWILMRVTE